MDHDWSAFLISHVRWDGLIFRWKSFKKTPFPCSLSWSHMACPPLRICLLTFWTQCGIFIFYQNLQGLIRCGTRPHLWDPTWVHATPLLPLFPDPSSFCQIGLPDSLFFQDITVVFSLIYSFNGAHPGNPALGQAIEVLRFLGGHLSWNPI